MVAAITPHSFRAGLASDLEYENVPKRRIKRAGRWDSDKAVEKYIRPRLAQRLRRLQYKAVQWDRHGTTVRSRATIRGTALDSSEGYDSSDKEERCDSDDGSTDADASSSSLHRAQH